MEYSQWRLIRIISILFTGAITVTANPDAPCYFPGGNAALLYQPCDRFAFASMCCPVGWTCYSNYLCILTDPNTATSDTPLGTTLRPTCTDPAWNETACGAFCLDAGSIGALTSCGNNEFCCRSEEVNGLCNCTTGKGVFSVASAQAQTIIDVSGLQYATLPTTRTTMMVTTTQTSKPVTSSSTSGSTTSVTASATQTAASSGSGDVTKTTRFKAGVGVAAAIVFCLLLAGLIWCFRRRRRKRNQQPQTSSSPPSLTQRTNGHFGSMLAPSYAATPPASRSSPVGGLIGIPIVSSEVDRPKSYPPLQRNTSGPLNSNPYVPSNNQLSAPGLDLYRHRYNLRPVSEITEPQSNSSSPTAERGGRQSPQRPRDFEMDVSPPSSPTGPDGFRRR